ncbi:MAG TPA: sigma-70 family RNA polymerase sigma factor [Acidimicrobiales bacterium]|nr:sigma-70 family RNA polymerase sigma factor [Acidimicrobiales bacterium]
MSEANPRGGADLTELVAAAKGGDREAFDAVVRATYAGTYGLALRLTANEEDAKDVVQEAYFRAYRGLKRFRGDASFTTWLYRITANCAATHLGKRNRHRHEDLSEVDVVDVQPDSDPEARAEAALLRGRVSAALDDLPPRLRAVVVLRDVYDLPHDAIAAELGITEAAAKVRLHRARLRLRAQLFPTRGGRAEEDVRAV